MKYNREFLKCEKCGNLVGVVENAGVSLYCCGAPMTKLVANTVDASVEKHLPAVSRADNELVVTVGEVVHPMTEAHHISWICVAQDKKTYRAALDVTKEPKASFVIDSGDATVYAYCNLHDLWAIDI